MFALFRYRKRPYRLEDKFEFYRDVSQTAYELSQRHGQMAHQHAAKLAAQAMHEGDEEGQLFWSAVAAALAPRHISS